MGLIKFAAFMVILLGLIFHTGETVLLIKKTALVAWELLRIVLGG